MLLAVRLNPKNNVDSGIFIWVLTATYDYCALAISKTTQLCWELVFNFIINVWFIILSAFVPCNYVYILFIKDEIYLQIINAYYNCVFISWCDYADHRSDLWSGYLSKAVGLRLGNCKNWIRHIFRPVEARKRKYQQAKVHSGLVCVLSVECQWGGGYRGIIQWYWNE